MKHLLLEVLVSNAMPLVIPPLVAAVRQWVVKEVNPRWIPAILTLGGALVNAVAEYLGVSGVPADLHTLPMAAWEGAILGLASTGVHQVYKQLRNKDKE